MKLNITCENCKKDFLLGKYSLLNRKHNMNLCPKCYTFIIRCRMPKEIHDLVFFDAFPFERIVDIWDVLNTKKKISFICEECNNFSYCSFIKMKRRKYSDRRPICNKCIMKLTCNHDTWKSINSSAQIIAQNKEETLLKQKISQNELKRNDPLFVVKRRSKGFISGKIDDIYFDSSWELLYLIHCFNNEKIIKVSRITSSIKYNFNNREHDYYPDFLIEYVDGSRKIIEIRGFERNIELDKCKYLHAKNMFGNEYEKIYFDNLKEMGIFVSSSVYISSSIREAIKKHNIEFDNIDKIQNWIRKYSLEKIYGKNKND